MDNAKLEKKFARVPFQVTNEITNLGKSRLKNYTPETNLENFKKTRTIKFNTKKMLFMFKWGTGDGVIWKGEFTK